MARYFERFAARPLALSAVAVLLCLSGCSHPVKTPAVLPVTSVSTASARLSPHMAAVAHIQSLPVYKQAEFACSQKQFLQASKLLESLAAAPGLNAEEIAFCREQRDLCLKDAGLLPKSTPAVASPPVSAPRSAEADCGPRALSLACRQLGVSASVAQLREWAGTTGKGTTLAGLARAAQKAGLKAEGVQVTKQGLATIDTPAIAWVRRQHYVVVSAVSGEAEKGTVTIHDPNEVKEQTMPQESLLQLCGGYLLLLHR